MTKNSAENNESGSISLENFKKLDNMTPEELKGWIRQFLETGNSYPINLWDHYGLPYEVILDLVKDLLPAAFSILKEKIKAQIAALVVSPLPRDEHEGNFLWEIITMASRLCISSARDALINWVKEGNLRGKLGHKMDLHYCVIDALANIGMPESELFFLVKRDMKDEQYVDVIYRAMSTIRPEITAEYFPQVTRLIKNTEEPRVLGMSVLRHLVEKYDERLFAEYFSEPIVKLGRQVDVDFVFQLLEILYPERVRDLFTAIIQELIKKGYDFELRPAKTAYSETGQVLNIKGKELIANSLNTTLIKLVPKREEDDIRKLIDESTEEELLARFEQDWETIRKQVMMDEGLEPISA